MQIPFHRPYITEDEVNAAAESIRKGWLTMGEKTFDFEEQFKLYTGSAEAVAVNSCTAALHLAFLCIDLQKGDEVIMPAMTFVATAEVVRYFDAVPVLVDVEKDSHLIDVSKIEEKITEKTRVIVPVHFAGQPADMNEIMSIARKYNLFVIEDAAHSLPASYYNRVIGSIGDMTCFSFYATKTLTTGEGGMVTTNNTEWAEKMRILRLHGISKDAWKRYSGEGSWEYDVTEAGFKYNTTDINSAMGIEQLKKLDFMLEKRKCIAEKYDQAFKDNDALIMYKIKENRESAWHLYPLKLNLDILSITRNQFIEELKERGISTSVHFIPLYRFSYYRDMGLPAEDYPASEWIFDRVVSLPIFPGMGDDEISYVIDNIVDVISCNRR